MIEADRVIAILLAAGQSFRFEGGDKLLADVEGKPLLLHAAERIIGLGSARRIAVCSRSEGDAPDLLAGVGFEIVVNPHPEQGLSSSLSRGVGEAVRGAGAAALICLADMPFVSLAHLQHLLDRFDAVTAPIVASARDGVAMPPALFSRSIFERLQGSEGDQGGRNLLRTAALVEASASELDDIDTAEDLGRMRGPDE
jgi:molybdenum cofactor cytidylyltransferase